MAAAYRARRDMNNLALRIAPVAEPPVLGMLARPAVVVTPRTSIAKAADLLVHKRVPALAVIDGGIRGLLTRTDVLRALADDRELAVGDAMSGFVFALPSSAPIDRAAALMAYEGVGQIVVSGPFGELVGMVSALDIARHYALEAGYLVE